MKQFIWVGLAATALLFTGCNSKKYFEPAQTFKPSGAVSSHTGKPVYVTREGVTFDTKTYLSKQGADGVMLASGENFLGESGGYVLVSDSDGKLSIFQKHNRKSLQKITFSLPVVSAAIKSGKVVYLLQDNTFGVYDIAAKRKSIESKSDDVSAVDARIANPIFVDNLAVIPTLDGKLLVVDVQNPAEAKVIYVGSKSSLDNIIYLSRIGNTLVAATPNRIMIIGSSEGEVSEGISEVVIDNNSIYLFTKAGEIIKYSSSLQEQARTKFKFAHYSVAAAFGGRVFALDQQGSLIVMDSKLKKSRIYDVGKIKDFAFVSGRSIYKDDEVIALDKLGL